MSTLAIPTATRKSLGARPAEVEGFGSVAFIACAAALITIVFVTPINESWQLSTLVDLDAVNNGEEGVESGTFSRQIALLGLAVFGVATIAWPGGRPLRIHGVLGVLCALYLAWCAASCLWSDDVGLSVRRWIALMCEVVAAAALVSRVSVRQFVWIVFLCTVAWLGLGVLAEVSQGMFQPWVESHRFTGMFHPNLMGVSIALLIFSTIYLGMGAQRHKWLFFTVTAIGIAFLWLTRSRTALLGTCAAVAFLWFIRWPTPRKLLGTLVIAMIVSCGTLLYGLGLFDISPDMLSMGRQDRDLSSLTGRLPLWQELIQDFLPQQPVRGHGYGAFWTADRFEEISEWTPSHAHSTYIDLMLNVGLVGALLCVGAMAWATMKASRLEVQRANEGYGFIAMLMVFALTCGLAETYIGTTWFLSFFGICAMCYLVLVAEQDGHLPPDGQESCIQPLGSAGAGPTPVRKNGTKTNDSETCQHKSSAWTYPGKCRDMRSPKC